MTWQKLKWPLVALGLVLLYNFFFTHGFFQLEIKNGRLYGSLIDILHRAAPMILVALGMTLVIATGGVDLSVGATMAITGTVAAQLLTETEMSVPVVVLCALGAALLAGIWNGVLVGYLKIPPIIATLVLMVSGRGIAQLMTEGLKITFDEPSFSFIGRGAFAGLPITVTIIACAFIILLIGTRMTATGLFIESTGDNEKASRYSGVSTGFVKLLVYAICGFLAGVAGLIATADIQQADASSVGVNIELDAILATVIGGTALTGGRFNLAGSLIGALLIQSVTTTILHSNIAAQWNLVVKAIVVIVVCLLQSESFRQTLVVRFRRSPA